MTKASSISTAAAVEWAFIPDDEGELLSRVPEGDCEGVKERESDAVERGDMAFDDAA